MTKRKLKSWIDAYIDYTKSMGSPSIMCKWAAISAVAGALERKTWVRTAKGELYPNLYVLLVGEPGVGKTVQTDLVYELWKNLSGPNSDTHKVCIQSVNHATIIDELVDAERKIVMPQHNPPVVSFNSLLVAVNEFTVLLPVYDMTMMANLTSIYDCKVYGQRRRGRDLLFDLENPQINLLSAVAPASLRNLLPEGAWDQGFLSRVINVYSGEVVIEDLWDVNEVDKGDLWEELKHDLAIIGSLYGPTKFTPDAAKAINEWQKAKGPPRPRHPKLTHYSTRRTAHLLKICMAVSASYNDDLIVTVDHYNEALNYLLEAEAVMPDIFKAMTSGGDYQVIEETWHFVYELYMRSKGEKPIKEGLIIQFISERTSAARAITILDVMIRGEILKLAEVNKAGNHYIPKTRKTF